MARFDFEKIANQYLGPAPEPGSPPATGGRKYNFEAIAQQYLGEAPPAPPPAAAPPLTGRLTGAQPGQPAPLPPMTGRLTGTPFGGFENQPMQRTSPGSGPDLSSLAVRPFALAGQMAALPEQALDTIPQMMAGGDPAAQGRESLQELGTGLLSFPMKPWVQTAEAVNRLLPGRGLAPLTPEVLKQAADGAGWTLDDLQQQLADDPASVVDFLVAGLTGAHMAQGAAGGLRGGEVAAPSEAARTPPDAAVREPKPTETPLPPEAVPLEREPPHLPTMEEVQRRQAERRQRTASREELARVSGFDPLTMDVLERRKGERRTPKPEELAQEPAPELPVIEEAAPTSRGPAPVESIPQKGPIRFFRTREDLVNAEGKIVQPKGRNVSEAQLRELGYEAPAEKPKIQPKSRIPADIPEIDVTARKAGPDASTGGKIRAISRRPPAESLPPESAEGSGAGLPLRQAASDVPPSEVRGAARPSDVSPLYPGVREEVPSGSSARAEASPIDAGVAAQEARRGSGASRTTAPALETGRHRPVQAGPPSRPQAGRGSSEASEGGAGGSSRDAQGAPQGALGSPGQVPGLRSDLPPGRAPSGVQPTADSGMALPEVSRGEAPTRDFVVVGPDNRYRGGPWDEATARAEARRRSAGGQEFRVERRQPPKAAEAAPSPAPRAETSVVSRSRYEAAKASLRKKTGGGQLNVGIDPTVYKDLLIVGAFHADRLATAAARGVAEFGAWSAEMAKEGYALTAAQMRRIWEAHEVRIVRERPAMPKGPIPAERGKLARWKREAGPERGSQAFDETRVAEDRMAHVVRRVHENLRREFKGVPKEERQQMTTALRGIAGRNADGSYRYGAISRAGTVAVESLADSAPGALLEDGRVVGPLLQDGKTTQLYRVTWPDEGQAAHDALVAKSPKAAKILDKILDETDFEPIVTAAGDRLPGLSRKELKHRYDIEGLTPEEADAASALVRKAYGPRATGKVTPNEWSWVPDVDLDRGTLSARLRGSFAYRQASSRFKKSGAIAERARTAGKDLDLREAWKKSTTELAIEDMRNQMVAKAFHILAEPIRKGETIESVLADGYTPLSRTGEYVASVKVRRRLKKLQQVLEDAGIDMPDVMDATYIAGGKGFKIPTRILNDLTGRPDLEATTSTKLRARMEAADKAIGDIIGSAMTWLLTGVSTANRNAVSQTLTFAPKVIRDFYRGVLQQIPGQQFQSLPMMDFLSDMRSLGVAHGKKVRTRMPPEVLGSTFLMDLEKAGPMTKVGGRVLRATGFNYWDVWGKRLGKEAVYHAEATRAWYALGKAGQKGLTKKAWIEEFKNGVPKEIEALAYREMEFGGGYDYDNIPRAVEVLKRSHVGRAILPYPTYFYKLLANTYAELMPSPRNIKNAFGADRGARINAYASMLTGATIFGTLWALVHSDEKPVDELTGELGAAAKRAEELSGRKVKESDLPGQVQKFGRVHVPGTEQWVRLIDQPFIGEVMAAKAIYGDNYTFNDWLNDRVSTGPLFNIVAAQQGLFNQYNEKLTVGARAGQALGSMLPMQGELRLARKMIDTTKRDPGAPNQSGFRNFAEGLADSLPVASTLLKPRIRLGAAEIVKYDRGPALASYALLNFRPINENERRAAIAAVGLAQLGETKTELNREKMRQQIEAIAKVGGSDVPTELQKFITTNAQEIEYKLTSTSNAIEIQRAWMDGGMEAAKTKALALIEASPQEWRGPLGKSANELMKKLAKESRLGLSGTILKKAPKRMRGEAADELQRLEAGGE